MKKKLPHIVLHFLLWIGVWFYFYYFFSYNSPDTGYVLWFSSCLLPLTMAITYFEVYYLIPRFLLPKGYGKFALYSFYTLVAASYFIVIIIYGCMYLYKGFNASNIPPMMKNFFFIVILVYLVVGLVSFITILNRNFKTEKRNQDLQNRMLEVQLQFKDQELNYLKKQIHPHFLFNTLNTIYGLAMQQSANTPEVILKLSNLLDYILYQVDKPRVSLKEEVEHIREYIELEKIRFQDRLRVNFVADIQEEEIQVAPMLLIPLVENAFKHGELVDGYLGIEVKVRIMGSMLDFSIRNTIKAVEAANENGGLGLENFRLRLDLNYKENYTLENRMNEGWYEARLKIEDLKTISDGK